MKPVFLDLVFRAGTPEIFKDAFFLSENDHRSKEDHAVVIGKPGDPSPYVEIRKSVAFRLGESLLVSAILGIRADGRVDILEFCFPGGRYRRDQVEALDLPAIFGRYARDGALPVLELSQVRRAIPYRDYGISGDENEVWDGPAEVAKMTNDQLFRYSAWYDETAPEKKESYKLPHHRASDGVAVWRGVVAAWAALHDARAPIQIPDNDKPSVALHLAKHYLQFGKDVPVSPYLK